MRLVIVLSLFVVVACTEIVKSGSHSPHERNVGGPALIDSTLSPAPANHPATKCG
jgi:hypothetical protein